MSEADLNSGENDTSHDDLPELVIPGVAHSNLDEDIGELKEVPDHESEEDAIEGIYLEIKTAMEALGVEKMRDVTQDDVIQLWQDMDMNQFLINDLILHTTTDKRSLKKSEYLYPSFSDLLERSERLINPYDVRRRIVEDIAPNLINLGHRRMTAYRLPRKTNEHIAQAWRVQGWLAGLPLLAELPDRIAAEMQTNANGIVKPSVQFKLTIKEIERQAQIVASDEFRKKYDMEITYNADAYADLQKYIKSAYKIANFALASFAAK